MKFIKIVWRRVIARSDSVFVLRCLLWVEFNNAKPFTYSGYNGESQSYITTHRMARELIYVCLILIKRNVRHLHCLPWCEHSPNILFLRDPINQLWWLVFFWKSECSWSHILWFLGNHEAEQWYLSGIRIRDAGIFELNLFHRFVSFFERSQN
jgi:hypothetical protein